MRKMQLDQVPAYCLHIRKYRETSVILQCFSEEFGRFDLLGKGLYRAKNKSDLPEYFQQYNVSGICKNELGILTALELAEAQPKLVGQSWLTACYANELLIKFLPRLEPVPDLYLSYAALLDTLHSERDYQLSLLWYEKRILEALGYGINFHYEAHRDEPINEDSWYRYSTGKGFYLCQASETNGLPGSLILSLADENWTSQDKNSFLLAKRVVRSALKYQLGDSALRTVAVSKDFQQFVQV